jgi:small subunit ribosomal protein S16
MVVIRLRREGTTKRPTYRLVVTDSRNPRDGRFIEAVGHYNPRSNPPSIVLKEEAILTWMGKGAKPSETVVKLLKKQGLYRKWLGQILLPPMPKEAEAPVKREEAKPAKKPEAKAKPKVKKAAKK